MALRSPRRRWSFSFKVLGTGTSAGQLPSRSTKTATTIGVTKSSRSALSKSCRHALSMLKGVEIPCRVVQALEQLSQSGIEANDRMAIGNLLTMVRSVQHILDMLKQRSQAAIENADVERVKRFDEQDAADLRVTKLEQVLARTRAALVSDTAEIETLRRSLEKAYVAMKRSEAELSTVVGKKRKFEDVEKGAYEVGFGNEAAEATDVKHLIISLDKVGRQHHFHKELMRIVPAILKKTPDRRCTFDGVVLHQLDAEFQKHAEQYDSNVKGKDELFQRHSAEVEAIRQSLGDADEERQSNTLAISEAEKALLIAKEQVVVARKHTRRFPAEMIQHYKNLARAEACAGKFRQGPLAAIEHVLHRTETNLVVQEEVCNEEMEKEEEEKMVEETEETEEEEADESGDEVSPHITQEHVRVDAELVAELAQPKVPVDSPSPTVPAASPSPTVAPSCPLNDSRIDKRVSVGRKYAECAD